MSSDNYKNLWNSYMEAYGVADADQRTRLLEHAVADNVVFTNPGGEGKNREDLIAHIGHFQDKMPGTYFRTDALHSHHGEILAIWSMYKADDMKLANGYNFVRTDDDGRFAYMAGFF